MFLQAFISSVFLLLCRVVIANASVSMLLPDELNYIPLTTQAWELLPELVQHILEEFGSHALFEAIFTCTAFIVVLAVGGKLKCRDSKRNKYAPSPPRSPVSQPNAPKGAHGSGRVRAADVKAKLSKEDVLKRETDAVAAAVRAGSAADLPRMLDAMVKKGAVLEPKLAEARAMQLLVSSLRACAARHCWTEALAVYDHMAGRVGAGCHTTWSLVLYSAVEARQFNRCPGMFKQILSTREVSCPDFLNMVRYFANEWSSHGSIHEFEQMLENLAEMGFRPDLITRNQALAGCVEQNALDLAATIVRKMYSLDMDVVAYNTLMKGYAQVGKLPVCFELYTQMRTAGLSPSEITFGILLDACISSRELEHARAIFNDLCNSGLQLNVVHYTTYIKGLVTAGKLEEAITVLDQMSEKSHLKPDLVTFSTLIKAYSVAGRVMDAVRLFERMLSQNIKPDGVVFNIVLTGCATHPMKEAEITHVFQWLVRHGLEPTTTTLSILMKAFARAELWDEAFQMLLWMPERHHLLPEPRIYAQLAQACAEAGSSCNALKSYAEMIKAYKEQGVPINEATHSRFRRICASCGQAPAASKLHKQSTRYPIDMAPGFGNEIGHRGH